MKSDADKINIDKLKNIPYNARNLKRKVEKIDVYKLVPVPVDLNKLSDAVKNDIIKKHVYSKIHIVFLLIFSIYYNRVMLGFIRITDSRDHRRVSTANLLQISWNL